MGCLFECFECYLLEGFVMEYYLFVMGWIENFVVEWGLIVVIFVVWGGGFVVLLVINLLFFVIFKILLSFVYILDGKI